MILLTPTTSKAKLRLEGVKTTSKRVAEKLLSAWQGFNEVDVSMRSAHVSGERSRRRVEIIDVVDNFMVAVARGIGVDVVVVVEVVVMVVE